MRNIVAGLFISLDGVFESPDQWHFPYRNDEMEEKIEVHPIVVGSGKCLFVDGSEQLPLQLVDAKTFDTGVLSLVYLPAGK